MVGWLIGTRVIREQERYHDAVGDHVPGHACSGFDVQLRVARDRMTPITEHFYWEEARCRCGKCTIPEDVKPEVVETARWLERIREHLGNRPVIVHSWYRCPEYNRKVGGAPNSQHLHGRAVDFTVRGMTVEQVWQHLLPLFWGGYVKGMGRYIGHVHVDRRPAGAAMWFGKGVRGA